MACDLSNKIYLDGYWQSEDYFLVVKKQVILDLSYRGGFSGAIPTKQNLSDC